MSFREYCAKAQLDYRQVLAEVRDETRNKDKYPDLLGKLFKDSRGRRCYCVARNPGKDAMFFIEGRQMFYHEVAEENVYKHYTEFDPPVIGDNPPNWWLSHTPGFTIGHKPVEARIGSRTWGGWYAAEIDSKFYILPASAIRKHFHEGTRQGGPLRKLDRLAARPDLI